MQLKTKAGYLYSNIFRLNFFVTSTANYGKATDCFLFNVSQERIEIKFNNLLHAGVLEIKTGSKCIIVEPGIFLLPAKLFLELLSKLDPAEEITILTTSPTHIKIVCQSGTYDFNTPLIDEFSDFKVVTEGTHYRLIESDLEYILNHINGFSVNDDTYESISGVLFKQEADVLHIVATNRKQLALIQYPITVAVPKTCVVPAKFLHGLKDQVASSDKSITIGFYGDIVYYMDDSLYVYGKVIDQEFPNYKPLTDIINSVSVSLPVDMVKKALGRIKLLLKKESPLIYLEFKKGLLSIKTEDKITNGEEMILIKDNTFEIKISANGLQLLSMINFFDQSCTLSFEPDRPSILQIKSKEHPMLTYLQTTFHHE